MGFRSSLAALKAAPSEVEVQRMLEKVRSFVRGWSESIDADFFTAFAYEPDGKMHGDLFRASEDAFVKIQRSFVLRQETFTEWVRVGVEYATELKTMRRSHVKELSAEKDIPTLTDGCACDPAWSTWI